jgi:hypothetical protein
MTVGEINFLGLKLNKPVLNQIIGPKYTTPCWRFS